MIKAHKPLTLKKFLSPETSVKLEAQKMLMHKAKVDPSSKKTSLPKVKQTSPSTPLKKLKQRKKPLTENELIQIRSKHEATDKAFALLYELFPNTFREKGFIPLMISVNECYEPLKNQLSKSLIKRALKKYIRQEDYQKAVFEKQFLIGP
ncbi:MAG: hypothetical protein IBJ00_05585 [Alphaproteobacteria bacterium]|nr:hypothetical protein [Alphaproteobacteria bacterium]